MTENAGAVGLMTITALMFLTTNFRDTEAVNHNLQKFLYAIVNLMAPTSSLDVFLILLFILIGILVEEGLIGRNKDLFYRILLVLAVYLALYGGYLFFTAPVN